MSDPPEGPPADVPDDWKPGSFTKNFSWGPLSDGLLRLWESIRLGFAGKMADVPRELFRERVRSYERPDFIPMNFFLFNRRAAGIDYIVADELVFQALNFPHSPRFDKLALFTFNFTYAGKFARASAAQRRPALWAHHYIRDRVGKQLNWNTAPVNADDIEAFLRDSLNYRGQQSRRKTATNLAYLYRAAHLNELRDPRVDRWWVDSLFLGLDRLIDDRKLDSKSTADGQLSSLLQCLAFLSLQVPKALRETSLKNI